jgi:hypothetical protein
VHDSGSKSSKIQFVFLVASLVNSQSNFIGVTVMFIQAIRIGFQTDCGQSMALFIIARVPKKLSTDFIMVEPLVFLCHLRLLNKYQHPKALKMLKVFWIRRIAGNFFNCSHSKL